MPFKDKQQKLEWDRNYYYSHKESRLAEANDYGKKHHKERNITRKLHRIKYPKLEREQERIYRLNHRDIIIASFHRRRSRLFNLPSDLSKEQWENIQVAYNYRCAYCGEKIEHPEQDHVLPVLLGGAYTASNIVPACRLCNSSKGTKLRTAQLVLC